MKSQIKLPTQEISWDISRKKNGKSEFSWLVTRNRVFFRFDLRGENRKMGNPSNRWQVVFGIVLGVLAGIGPVTAQDDSAATSYAKAMKSYEAGEYKTASDHFSEYYKIRGAKGSANALYNGACIFALNDEQQRAIEILDILVAKHYYSDEAHIIGDPDLETVRELPAWKKILERVKENKKTLPKRLRAKIKKELFKAREILQADDGKLWGYPIWNNDILVLDFDNTVYSLKELPDSKTEDSILFYKTLPENTLSFTNSAQEYDGKRVAVVMANYLDDECETIIHELFHVVQLRARDFRGDPVDYLDQHDARELLRLEFQALRNGLRAADQEKAKSEVESWLVDALMFRKIRQFKYKSYLQGELEIETLEGMANYTGMVLSGSKNKFADAIAEIRGREAAETYTRPFPYATGPAYGLLFDHLQVQWKSDIKTVHNFLEIYEKHLGKKLVVDDASVDRARARNNYDEIHRQEVERKLVHEKNVKFYTRMLVNQPSLRAAVTDGSGTYSVSFNMNGTLALDGIGTVYSSIKGVDVSGKNFGSFQTIAGKDTLGVSGILSRTKEKDYVFPLPLKIEGNKVVGETYTIDINEGWEVKKINERGDLEIVKSK